MSDYNVIVIGAGPGGYVAAIKCAALGLKTAVIESCDVGGTCLNRGCIPTKSLLHSAELYSSLSDSGLFGVNVGEYSFDFAKMHERKSEVVAKLRGGVENLFTANKIELIRGAAQIQGSGKVSVNGTALTSDNIIIATGSKPALPPIPGLKQEGVVTSDELLDGNAEFNKSLIIIGGGVIGVEFASVYASLGCEVTIVEALDRVLANMDREISQNLTMILKKRGVKINTGSMVKEIVRTDSGMTCRFECKGKEGEVIAERILVAIGRRPNTEGLLAEGVELTIERGRIITNEKFETSIPGVYAIGDVTSRIQLAHTASAQGIFVAEMLAGHTPSINLDVVPSCIYTSPEIAAVGITADEAKEKGIEVKTGKYLMLGNGKTIIANGERGFIKVVADCASGVVLGAQLMCERATDMLNELSTAVTNKLTVDQLLSVIRPHPTFGEGVTEALENVNGTSIHSVPARK